MSTQAQVVVLPEESSRLYIDDVEIPEPGPHEVVVKQFATGICGSQLRWMHTPRDAPGLLGHESTGTVLDVGSDVTAVRPGDRVMITWVPRAGRPAQVSTLTLSDGALARSQNVFTWADHTIVDEAFVVPLPDWAPFDVASVVGCAVMTGAGAVMTSVHVAAGQRVAVIGAGGVGLPAIAAAAAVGADPVIAVDIDAHKLELAQLFGATHVVNSSIEDVAETVRRLTPRTDGRLAVGGADFVFDCVGNQRTIEQSLDACYFGARGEERRGGVAVIVGIPHVRLAIDLHSLLAGEKSVTRSTGGSAVVDRDFPAYLELHRSGALDLGALVTERFALSEINQATQALAEGRIRGRAIVEFAQ